MLDVGIEMKSRVRDFDIAVDILNRRLPLSHAKVRTKIGPHCPIGVIALGRIDLHDQAKGLQASNARCAHATARRTNAALTDRKLGAERHRAGSTGRTIFPFNSVSAERALAIHRALDGLQLAWCLVVGFASTSLADLERTVGQRRRQNTVGREIDTPLARLKFVAARIGIESDHRFPAFDGCDAEAIGIRMLFDFRDLTNFHHQRAHDALPLK